MIVFFSSFLSPHVKPFCDYLYEHTQGQFIYVETQKLSDERRAMGYSYDGQNIPYLRNIVKDIEACRELVHQADCVLINPGSSDYALTEYCVQYAKIVFLVSERLFKHAFLKLLDPRLWKQVRINWKARRRNVYLLCLGSFVAHDYALVGFKRENAYKFGYFPESQAENAEYTETRDHCLIWVGRLIDWKRPVFALRVMEALKKENIDAHLLIAGDGAQREKVEKYISARGLSDRVTMLGMTNNNDIRKLMRTSKALISTSTRQEGWGAVVNEALDAGIPVISAVSIGAAGYLIRDGENGFTFNTYSVRSAVSAIKRLNAADMAALRENARDTMKTWNAPVAGDRFLQILKLIERGNSSPEVFTDGPMSKA